MTRYVLPVLLLGSMAGMSVWLASRSTEQTAARQLSQSLRRHQYYYSHALDREGAVITTAVRSLDSGAPLDSLHREILEIRADVVDLYGRLRALPVNGAVRDRVLAPLLDQLHDESEELADIAGLLTRAGDSGKKAELRQKLDNHRHPANLLAPALQQIADQYGLPRPRLWRGRPLVS